jgi:hypothetical protein
MSWSPPDGQYGWMQVKDGARTLTGYPYYAPVEDMEEIT